MGLTLMEDKIGGPTWFYEENNLYVFVLNIKIVSFYKSEIKHMYASCSINEEHVRKLECNHDFKVLVSLHLHGKAVSIHPYCRSHSNYNSVLQTLPQYSGSLDSFCNEDNAQISRKFIHFTNFAGFRLTLQMEVRKKCCGGTKLCFLKSKKHVFVSDNY